MNKLLLAFYGDDFTGSTDALEQLTLAGIRAVLFIEPPRPAQLKRFPGLQAVGVAGMTRSLAPAAMKRELRPALKQLKALGARHVHYKICSTFDSSPQIGNIGCVLDVASEVFHGPFVPLLVATPGLGRHCVFGNLFARFGIGSNGEIHRLDRHPSISKHPVTPMKEADLRLHLANQTKREIALFDILQLALPEKERRDALKKILAKKPGVVLFDALYRDQLMTIGELIESYASAKHPLFSIGSSGIETALAACWARSTAVALDEPWRKASELPPHPGPLPWGEGETLSPLWAGRQPRTQSCAGAVHGSESHSTLKTGTPQNAKMPASSVKQMLAASGSCSPVTARQIARALKAGFAEVALNVAAFNSQKNGRIEIKRATDSTIRLLQAGRSVVVHTTRNGANQRMQAKLKYYTGEILGRALGNVLRGALEETSVRRVCIAGGDTASFAARAMGIEALEMIAPLTPGAPLCRVSAPGSPADGLEVVFKGGQVGPENYFGIVKQGGNH